MLEGQWQFTRWASVQNWSIHCDERKVQRYWPLCCPSLQHLFGCWLSLDCFTPDAWLHNAKACNACRTVWFAHWQCITGRLQHNVTHSKHVTEQTQKGKKVFCTSCRSCSRNKPEDTSEGTNGYKSKHRDIWGHTQQLKPSGRPRFSLHLKERCWISQWTSVAKPPYCINII